MTVSSGGIWGIFVELISSERILPALQATAKKEVLREIAVKVGEQYPETGAENVYSALLERESLGSTGVGDGIAIPHAKLASLHQLLVFFARSEKGVHFDAHDSRPVHLFFIMLAPSAASASYLATLAKLSRFLKSETIRNRLLQASGVEPILTVLSELKGLE